MFPLVTKTLEALRGKSDQDIGMIAAAWRSNNNAKWASLELIKYTLQVIFKAALKGSSSDIHWYLIIPVRIHSIGLNLYMTLKGAGASLLQSLCEMFIVRSICSLTKCQPNCHTFYKPVWSLNLRLLPSNYCCLVSQYLLIEWKRD